MGLTDAIEMVDGRWKRDIRKGNGESKGERSSSFNHQNSNHKPSISQDLLMFYLFVVNFKLSTFQFFIKKEFGGFYKLVKFQEKSFNALCFLYGSGLLLKREICNKRSNISIHRTIYQILDLNSWIWMFKGDKLVNYSCNLNLSLFRNGYLSFDEFHLAISNSFPSKNEDEISDLFQSLDQVWSLLFWNLLILDQLVNLSKNDQMIF